MSAFVAVGRRMATQATQKNRVVFTMARLRKKWLGSRPAGTPGEAVPSVNVQKLPPAKCRQTASLRSLWHGESEPTCSKSTASDQPTYLLTRWATFLGRSRRMLPRLLPRIVRTSCKWRARRLSGPVEKARSWWTVLRRKGLRDENCQRACGRVSAGC